MQDAIQTFKLNERETIMLTAKELEKFLKKQLNEHKNVWGGQFRVSEENLFYAFNIQGVKRVVVLFGVDGFSLIPVNNGEFFIKKIVTDDIKFFTIELEDLENLVKEKEDVTFELTVFDKN